MKLLVDHQYTPEWHALRTYDPDRDPPVVFGASEAAAALGVNPYVTPLDLYMLKTGRKSVANTELMQMGLDAEPMILSAYERRTGKELNRELGCYQHEQHRFQVASPDARVCGEDTVVDAKWTSFRQYDETGLDTNKYGPDMTDLVPTYVACQCQQLMDVLHCDTAHIAALFDRHLRVYVVKRHDDLIEAIRKAEREMSERIINQDPPDPNWSNPMAKKLIQQVYPREQGRTAVLDAPFADMWVKAETLRQEIKDLEQQREEYMNKIRWEMQGSEFAIFRGNPELELHRIQSKDSYWTQEQIDELEAGQKKRSGTDYIKARKRT